MRAASHAGRRCSRVRRTRRARRRPLGASEPALVVELLPTGHALIPTVQRDQAADDVGGVLEDGHALVLVELAVADAGGEVVLAERGGPGRLSPGLDGCEVLLGDEFLPRGVASGRGGQCFGESVAQVFGGTTAASGGAVEVDAWIRGAHRLETPRENALAVAADLVAELLPLFDGGGFGDGVDALAAEALLDAVLAEQDAERVAELAAVLAVHQGRSLDQAASSMSSSSSTESRSTPCDWSSSIAAYATSKSTSRL